MRFPYLLAVLAICLAFTNTSSSAPVSDEEEPLLDKNPSQDNALTSPAVSTSQEDTQDSYSAFTRQEDELLPGQLPGDNVIAEIGTTSSQLENRLDKKTNEVQPSTLATTITTMITAAKLICWQSWHDSGFLEGCRNGDYRAEYHYGYVDLETRIKGFQLAFVNMYTDLPKQLLFIETDMSRREMLERLLEGGSKSGSQYLMVTILEQGIDDQWMAKEVVERLFLKSCQTELHEADQHPELVYVGTLYEKVDPMTRTQGLFHALDKGHVTLLAHLLQYGQFDDKFEIQIGNIMKTLFLWACEIGEDRIFFALLDKVDPETRREGFLKVQKFGTKGLELPLLKYGKFDKKTTEIVEAYEHYRDALKNGDWATISALHNEVEEEMHGEGHELGCHEHPFLCKEFYQYCEPERRIRKWNKIKASEKIEGECSEPNQETERKNACGSSHMKKTNGKRMGKDAVDYCSCVSKPAKKSESSETSGFCSLGLGAMLDALIPSMFSRSVEPYVTIQPSVLLSGPFHLVLSSVPMPSETDLRDFFATSQLIDP